MSQAFVIATMLSAALFGTPAGASRAAQPQTEIISAQGSPYLNDFMVASQKRADVRLLWQRKGRDAAFTEWLRRERPYAYRQILKSKRGE
jgi:hypothetical protein